MEATTTHTLTEPTAIQTIAQAVAQATQQAQIGIQQQSQPSAVDNLTCQWQGCGERTDSAEALYDHVCERHVGRKSTNNLNLTCQWGACRTTTVKRDHITSHIRVHVPLKPHKCDFCGKSFKRPQDLKKHVKTHADDSVLANSPQQNSAGRNSIGGNGGLGTQNGGTTGYYQSGDGQLSSNAFSSYQSGIASNGGNNGGYQSMNNGQYGGYGSVSYPSNAAMADIQSMDTRRRAIEALNDFLGDIKRRAINPNNYYDVGHRLQGNSLPLPVSNGYNTGYNNIGTGYNGASAASLLDSFNNGDHMGGGLHGGMTQHGYSLPVPNARTKNDLQDIDRFLEQLQATVYETSTHAAAAGVQQPGMHTQYAGDYSFGSQQRSSHSPTNFNNYGTTGSNSLGGLLTSAMQNMPNGTTGIETPALTPSSMSSYTSSGHSPMSNQSRASLGSLGGTSMYPSLPSVTSMSDLGSGYPTTTSAPASSLASGYEGLDGRRYSGGRLQRQAPDHDTEMADVDDGSRTPKASDVKEPKTKGNNTIDPALRGEDGSDSGSTSASRSDGEDKRQEEWIENIRTIEALRKWISQRLQTGEYEDGEEQADGDATTGADAGADADAAAKTAEIAKLVEEKMADAEAAKSGEEMDVKYPSLPST